MSAFSTVGGLFIGGVAAIAGIVTVETRPEPTSAIVICEDYVPAAPGDMQAQVVGGALADRASMHALGESNHALATAIKGLTATLEKVHAHATENEADEVLKKRVDEMVEERLRALEAPAPTRRPPRG